MSMRGLEISFADIYSSWRQRIRRSQRRLQDDVPTDSVWWTEECVQSEEIHNRHRHIQTTLQGRPLYTHEISSLRESP